MSVKGNIRGALALAVLAAFPAAAQMPTPAAMLHSKFIDDCKPKALADELCRLPVVFEADEAERRLGSADLAYWIDGQTLNIAARVQGDRAVLAGTIDEGMTPLSTRRPLWGAAYRVTALNRSIIELRLKNQPAGTPAVVYRGPDAPPVPPSSAMLKGRLDTVDINSTALGAVRKVALYTPPGSAPRGGWPVVIAAAGQDIAPYAAIADALIERHEIRPVAIVALSPGHDDADAPLPGAREYVRGRDPSAFARHNMFFRREALPMAAKRLKLSARPADRMLFGIGAGADWALDTAVRDPAMAGTVAAFSPPGLSEFPFRNRALRIRLEAGAYEPPYLKGARTTCNLAGASASPCTLDVTNAGHAPLIWQAEWAKVLKATFPARARAAKR